MGSMEAARRAVKGRGTEWGAVLSYAVLYRASIARLTITEQDASWSSEATNVQKEGVPMVAHPDRLDIERIQFP